MESLIPIIFGAFFVGVIPLFIAWSLTRSQRMLDQWAAEHDLTHVSATPCWVN